MNRQPYCAPPRWWEPKLTPWWVRVSRRYRRRQLRRKQQLMEIQVDNLRCLRDARDAGHGILITPNHSAHYDAPALYAAADAIDQPLYFMTAWQVFAMSSLFEQWAMQRLGCFSIDREGNDRQAFKQAVQALQVEPYPLVVFPEGDIYHTTDFVTPFREGAAAIAVSAAKRADRTVVVLPCGIKFWYLDDPTEPLKETLRAIESRLYLRSDASLSLAERIHRLAEAALALKELDYLGYTRTGRLRDRIGYLLEAVLDQLEKRHGIESGDGTMPERVKALRQAVIRNLSECDGDAARARTLGDEMEDLFFAMQLFSYRGDYLVGQPSIERLAETVDKFEEDILGLDYPSVRGRRSVVIRFGEPVPVDPSRRGRGVAAQLTRQLEDRVQGLIQELNVRSSTGAASDTMHL